MKNTAAFLVLVAVGVSGFAVGCWQQSSDEGDDEVGYGSAQQGLSATATATGSGSAPPPPAPPGSGSGSGSGSATGSGTSGGEPGCNTGGSPTGCTPVVEADLTNIECASGKLLVAVNATTAGIPRLLGVRVYNASTQTYSTMDIPLASLNLGYFKAGKKQYQQGAGGMRACAEVRTRLNPGAPVETLHLLASPASWRQATVTADAAPLSLSNYLTVVKYVSMGATVAPAWFHNWGYRALTAPSQNIPNTAPGPWMDRVASNTPYLRDSTGSIFLENGYAVQVQMFNAGEGKYVNAAFRPSVSGVTVVDPTRRMAAPLDMNIYNGSGTQEPAAAPSVMFSYSASSPDVTLSWTNAPLTGNTWVAISQQGSANNSFVPGGWSYTGSTGAGTAKVAKPTVGGNYIARLYSGGNGYNVVTFTNAFFNVAAPQSTVTANYSNGAANVTGNWTGSPAGGWVAFGYAGSASNSWVTSLGANGYRYTGATNGAYTMPTPPAAQYVTRLFDGPGNMLASSPAFTTVSGAASVSYVGANASNVTVGWANAPAASASPWVALSIVGSPATSYTSWSYISSISSPVNLTRPSPGQYEIRMYQNGFDIAAKSGPINL